MKLLLRRNQRDGLLGKVIFSLEVRADLSDAERGALTRYKLSNALLYQRNPKALQETWSGMAKHLVHQALDLTIHARDLADGKKIECKDILEMLAVEEQIKEAAQNLAAILRASAFFGGEEVIEL